MSVYTLNHILLTMVDGKLRNIVFVMKKKTIHVSCIRVHGLNINIMQQ